MCVRVFVCQTSRPIRNWFWTSQKYIIDICIIKHPQWVQGVYQDSKPVVIPTVLLLSNNRTRYLGWPAWRWHVWPPVFSLLICFLYSPRLSVSFYASNKWSVLSDKLFGIYFSLDDLSIWVNDAFKIITNTDIFLMWLIVLHIKLSQPCVGLLSQCNYANRSTILYLPTR